MSAKGTVYYLDGDDVVNPSFVTEDNKASLQSGGLFDDLVSKSGSHLSLDSGERQLFVHEEAADVVTLDWGERILYGAWNIDGSLTVSDPGPLLGSLVDGIEAASPLRAEYDEEDEVLRLSIPTLTGLIQVSKAIHVSPAGQDTDRDDMHKYDLPHPYLTIKAAVDAASSGDTIVVWPGQYTDEYNLLKDGVNIHFLNGAVVTQSNTNQSLFHDSGGASNVRITGHGVFADDRVAAPALVQIAQEGSNLRLTCSEMTSAANSDFAVKHAAGTLKLEVGMLHGGTRTGGSGLLLINNTRATSIAGVPTLEVAGSAVSVMAEDSWLRQLGSAAAVNFTTSVTASPVQLRNVSMLVQDSEVSISANVVASLGSQIPTLSLLPGVCANKEIQENLNPAIADIQILELSPFTVAPDLTYYE